jgi:hypothetical protein
MLHAHPDVVCGGEGHLTDWVLSPLRRLLEDYNEQLQTNNALIYQERATHAGFTEGDFKQIAALIINQCFAKLGRLKPAPAAIGDKTPNYIYAMDLLSTLFPDSLCVFLVRDPRDSAVSMVHQTRRLERQHETRLYNEDDEVIGKYLEKWVAVNTLFRQHQRAYPGRSISVRYEDLHADEAGTLRRIFKFLNVPAGNDVLQTVSEAGRFSTLASGRARGQIDDTSFFRRGEVGSWRTELGGKVATHISAEAAEIMQQLNY